MFRVLLSALIFTSGTAMAQAVVATEEFYQPAAGKQAVTPAFKLQNQEIKADGGGKTKISESSLGVKYEYGLNDNWTFGANIAYQLDGKFEPSGGGEQKIKGLQDIQLFTHTQWGLGAGSLHAGLNLFVSPGDREVDSSGDANAMSGGHSAELYAGYVLNVGPGAAGLRLSTELDLGDRTEKDKSSGTEVESKNSKGNRSALRLFYEHALSQGLIAGRLTWENYNTLEKSESNGLKSESAGYNAMDLGVYGTYKVQEGATVLANLDYTFTGGGQGQIDTITGLKFGLAGRFEF